MRKAGRVVYAVAGLCMSCKVAQACDILSGTACNPVSEETHGYGDTYHEPQETVVGAQEFLQGHRIGDGCAHYAISPASGTVEISLSRALAVSSGTEAVSRFHCGRNLFAVKVVGVRQTVQRVVVDHISVIVYDSNAHVLEGVWTCNVRVEDAVGIVFGQYPIVY